MLQKPDENHEDLIARGKQLFWGGAPYKGLHCIAQVVINDPANIDAKSLFIDFVSEYHIPFFDNIIRQAIVVCLDEDRLGHNFLFRGWYSSYLTDPEFAPLHRLSEKQDFEAFLDDFSFAEISTALNNPYLTKALSKIIVRHEALEKMLTYTRRALLFKAGKTELTRLMPFIRALNIQCFLNEYIFDAEDKETQKVRNFFLDSEQNNAAILLLAGCYEDFYKQQNSRQIKQILAQSDLPGSAELIKLIFDDKENEENLKKSIRCFGKIKNSVSQAVQLQYEQNPYPRWQSSYAAGGAQNPKRAEGKKILSAGCGTGQQVANLAMAYPAAQITAVDLSLSSLAYGQRKINEFGLSKNVEFLQGDLLDLKELDRKFDYVACGGVLHHMQSPVDGLKSLKEQLNPGGVIRLGLYSKVARRDIIKIQKWIKKEGFPATAEGIRECRRKLREDTMPGIFGMNTLPGDFFTTSECRDLLFHVQEHNLTCLDIKRMVEEAEMEVIVFAAEMPYIKQLYHQHFPNDPRAVNLENWDILEAKYPYMFLGMYQFFVASKGECLAGNLPAWLRDEN